MDIRGCCFWAKDYPNNGTDHYIVVVSSENDDNKALIVPFSSIKFEGISHKYNGRPCKYYDVSCVFDAGDIKDTDNKPIVVTRPSYIRYEWAQEIDVGQILAKQVNQQLNWQCTVDKSVLEKIQNGAKTSDELPEYYQKYFKYF